MTLLYLIRHGENIDGKVGGVGPTVDLGLSDIGRDQVERLCKRLTASGSIKPSVLLSSTERRAADTAQLLGAALGLGVTPSSDLEEWRSDDGNVEPEEFMAQWRALKERERAFHRFQPQSETQAAFFVRVGAVLHAISKEHEGGSIALVTHGGFIQASFRHFFGFGDASFRRAYPAAAHTSITHWHYEQGSDRWVLAFANDARHLESAA
jgi:probable phosphoglycerate mutase